MRFFWIRGAVGRLFFSSVGDGSEVRGCAPGSLGSPSGGLARDDGGEKGRKSENDGSAGSWRILLCKRTGAGRFRFLNGGL